MGIIKKFYKKQKKSLTRSVSKALLGDEHYKKAQKYEAKGDYKKAAKEYVKLEAYHKAAELYEMLGDQAGQKKPEKGVRYYRSAIEYGQEDAAILRVAAKLAACPGVPSTELALIASQLCDLGAFDAAGSIYEQLDDHDNAARCYEESGNLERYDLVLNRKSELEFNARFQAEVGAAPTPSSSKSSSKKASKSNDFEARIHKLQTLFDAGMISHDEFESKRQEILRKI